MVFKNKLKYKMTSQFETYPISRLILPSKW